METSDLNSYGHYIGSIIIGVVFIIGLIIIIDELISVSRFCYRYTYLYNYGKATETTCKENKLEYERARFKIYNEMPNYKFIKDVFNKSWINYVYYISVFILSILLCIAFGYLFHNFFIEGNKACTTTTNDISNWSFLKVVMKCFCGDCHEYIPNCLVNYILLFIIILIYPLTFILKLTIKMDFTTASNGIMSRLFHLCVFALLVYYIMIIYVENSSDKYMKIMIYVIYVTIFYANNYLFNKTFDEYNSLVYESKENKDDTTFFDIYKQEEPIKPTKVPEPPQLKTFKYCSTANFNNPKDKYCYKINSNLPNYPEINLNNEFYRCLSPEIKTKIQNLNTDRKFYEMDKIMMEEYYKQLKDYENDMNKYNYKYNIYMNNKTEFPEIVYFLYHMCPKLLGLHKQEIQLFFILIIILIFITYYLKTIDNRYADYLYYTAFMYVVGLLSIAILVNAVLNYNTYVNKYLIYEPTHNYKNLMNNKHTILNLIITKDNNLKELFKIYTDKYNDKINGVNLIQRLSKFSKNGTLESFVEKVKKGNISAGDNINNPTREESNNQYLLNLQIKFYKTIYSSMMNIDEISNNYLSTTITNRYLSLSSDGDIDNYNRFNKYKTSLTDANYNYVEYPVLLTQTPNTSYINEWFVYFFLLIKKVFVTTDLNIKTKIKQLRLNFERFVYNIDDMNYNNDRSINFVSFLDNRNYTENEITRDDTKEIPKLYDYNRDYIDKAFDTYGEFLKEFRIIIVDLLTTSGISCQYTDYIEIQDKLNEYYKKIFSNSASEKSINRYLFKTATQEPKIDIYKRVLQISIEKVNELMVRYMNIIKVYMKSFELTPMIAASSENKLKNEEMNIIKMIGKVKNNFNIFNKEFNRHNDESLLKMGFRMDTSNYKRSKYDKFTTGDIKKLNISTDNVSWSFIILIIIFAIILIEPTLI